MRYGVGCAAVGFRRAHRLHQRSGQVHHRRRQGPACPRQPEGLLRLGGAGDKRRTSSRSRRKTWTPRSAAEPELTPVELRHFAEVAPSRRSAGLPILNDAGPRHARKARLGGGVADATAKGTLKRLAAAARKDTPASSCIQVGLTLSH